MNNFVFMIRTVCVLLISVLVLTPFVADSQASEASDWVEKKMKRMTLEDKIGQLFMIAAYSNRNKAYVDSLAKVIDENGIGGLIFFQGNPESQIAMTNRFQKTSKIPMLIGIDAEWGLSMRLQNTASFPMQMTMAAANDSALVYDMGKELARQCKRMGVHINFAPVVDVNTNPNNPVIGMRAFGQSKLDVTRFAKAYMHGLQDNGIMACAKHFPGHGDAASDSHKTLPFIYATKDRFDDIELYPFRALIRSGIQSIMIAHLNVPALTNDTSATTFSPLVVQSLLKGQMGFKGLVFTDALNMKGATLGQKPGEPELKSLMAGNDVLLFSRNVQKAKERLIEAVADSTLSIDRIDDACRKILLAKFSAGFSEKFEKIDTASIVHDLNSKRAELIYRRLTEKSLTLLQNEKDLVPLRRLDTLNIALVSIGGAQQNAFITGAERYAPIKSFVVDKDMDEPARQALLDSLKPYNLVLMSVHANIFDQRANYGIGSRVLRTVRDININHKSIVSVFGNPYALNEFFGLKDVAGVLMAYENTDMAMDYASQAIFGGISIQGKLPVKGSPWFKKGAGIETTAFRLKYSIPEDEGIASSYLIKIDSLFNVGIEEGAYPGGQVLVARKGTVIYEKGFGFHTYDNKRPVRKTDIYDLASVTKIAATTVSIMRLTDEGKISIDSTLGEYIPELVGESEYKSVVLRQMMAHQAGFFPWIPFYLNTLTNGKPDQTVYRKQIDERHSKRVADSMYAKPELRDSILARIIRQPIGARKKYKYSDFGFYLLHKIIEDITGEPLEQYVQSSFYKKLGMTTMMYNPRDRFQLSRIAPTEYDTSFRQQLVHGDVHDQGAAMMGGVSGHAGLFSNANDLAKMMQMMLNGGTYGGESFITDTTLGDFTRCQYCDNDNRRGAGFDKPVRSQSPGPTCGCVSYSSFGHTGFTGITAWADPDQEVVYIFISNRVYPIADNKKILRLNTRTDIQQVIYDGIKKGVDEEN